MDTSQWPQEIVGKPVVEEVAITKAKNIRAELKEEAAVSCPRCNSRKTKFCYYNNYSLTQPRYFCKACRRYWTEGGSLRNIPVGGGSRKNNKRPSSYNSTPQNPNNINPITTHSQDLNLSFPPTSHHHFITSNNNNNLSAEIVVGGGNNPIAIITSASTTTTDRQVSAMELLTGMAAASNDSRPGLSSCFVPDHPGSVYAAGFPDLRDSNYFKSSLGFSLNGYGGVPTAAGNNGGAGRLMQLPFEDLKQGSNGVEQGKELGADSTGYWTGMLGGGSW